MARIDRSNSLDEGGGITAHITPVDGMHRVLDENNVALNDLVMDFVSDLLVDLVREEEGSG